MGVLLTVLLFRGGDKGDYRFKVTLMVARSARSSLLVAGISLAGCLLKLRYSFYRTLSGSGLIRPTFVVALSRTFILTCCWCLLVHHTVYPYDIGAQLPTAS